MVTKILFNKYNIDEDWCFVEFKKYIHDDHKVVIIPFSLRSEQINSNEMWQKYYEKDTGLYFNGIVDSFSRYGIKSNSISWINYFKDNTESSRYEISNADIIYYN